MVDVTWETGGTVKDREVAAGALGLFIAAEPLHVF